MTVEEARALAHEWGTEKDARDPGVMDGYYYTLGVRAAMIGTHSPSWVQAMDMYQMGYSDYKDEHGN